MPDAPSATTEVGRKAGPIKTTEGLKPGDVLMVAKQITPHGGGEPYWWKSFRCVTVVEDKAYAELLVLKMVPDLDKDMRLVDFAAADHVITVLDIDKAPQGVVAMRMKHILKGLIVLDE